MTQSNRMTALKARHAAEIAEMEAIETLAELLPEGIKLPTVSNLKLDAKPGEVAGWLSFRPESYSEDKNVHAQKVLDALEKSGAKPVPACLIKWGNYRRTTFPGLLHEVPETRKSDKLTDSEAIAPLWITPNQHTSVEVRAFYQIGGKTYKVTVETQLPVFLQCRRVESPGSWRYEGPCSIRHPQNWHALYVGDGNCVANISAHSRGYRDTEQGLSGEIYFQPNVPQVEFPLSPSAILAQLIAFQK